MRPIENGATAIAAIGSGAVGVYQMRFPPNPVFNIPYFCVLTPFRTASIVKCTRNKPTVNILLSGQLIERKSVDVLIREFIQIAPEVPALHLHLLGSGPTLGDLTNLIPFCLPDRVQLL